MARPGRGLLFPAGLPFRTAGEPPRDRLQLRYAVRRQVAVEDVQGDQVPSHVLHRHHVEPHLRVGDVPRPVGVAGQYGSMTKSSVSPTHRGSSNSVLSLWSQDSVLSIGSVGSVLSIGSVGSALSVGSIGSALSVGSIGSALSLISAGSWLSTGSVLSAQSRWSVLSWRASGGYRAFGAVGVLAVAGVLAARSGATTESRRRNSRARLSE